MNWIYDTNEDNSARFTLGEYGDKACKTLICFGINPSTATPDLLDNTLKKVKTIAVNNGYLNWIMLNIYPQRATNPNDLHIVKNDDLRKKNLEHVKKVLTEFKNSDILFAFGNLITKRDYLLELYNEIVLQINSCGWNGKNLCIKLTKQGYPAHPLYQSGNSKLTNFIN